MSILDGLKAKLLDVEQTFREDQGNHYSIQKADGVKSVVFGDGFFVADGYLFVFQSAVIDSRKINQSVAAYPPDTWKGISMVDREFIQTFH